ncbi:MAG: T9SS type A sorting domain-containing protein [Bacteroidales bacterium]|nr:T9SS type A sorting domain-containing protein [Bacteroidales bacterium]
MKNLYKMLFATAVLLVFGLAGSVNAQSVVYVSSDGTGDGTSWANAAGSIQDVIESSDSGTDIWIKGGTYYVPGDSTFILKDGVSLYGGFSGTETCPIQRTDYRLGGANETILSGDIDKNGVTDAANANRVVYGKDITNVTTLDGLTITGGYADASSDDGAGLRLSNGSPNIINCTLFDNWCGDNGAGFYIATTSIPAVTGCYFVKNYAADKGGAVYTATGCDAVFTNCVFSNNSAVNDGGAVRVYKSSPTFMNCTFTRNSLPGAGDGPAIEINNSVSAPVFTNSVSWGNTESGVVSEDITLTTDGTVTLINCAMEGTYTATGATVTGLIDISSTDPLFVNTSGASGSDGYDVAADWAIQATSVLIDAGLVAGAPVMDIIPGFRDATPDVGAYEYGAAVPFIIAGDITGYGTITPFGVYVVSGADQAFTLTPRAGYELTAATYNGTDIMPSLTDNGDRSFGYTATAVNADGMLAVTFEPEAVKYTVAVTAGAGGTISPVGDTAVTVTDEVVFTITPDAGFVFAEILLNGTSVMEQVTDNGDGTYTYTLIGVGENSTLSVSFLELFTVTISAGANGSVDPSGSVDVTINDETEFTITADAGYILDAITLDGTDVTGDVVDNGDGTYTYLLTGIDADATLAVTFVEMVVSMVYITEGGTGDGSSWANASGDIQVAIDAGEIGTEIWVAKGKYLVPTDTSFTLKSGVSLYGGFAGTESSKDERSQYRMGEANETQLSADVDGNGYLTGGNAPRVIYGESISALTTIDGFIITGGFSDIEKSNGAGMKLRASSPNVVNCTFYDNYCDDGAGLYLYRSGDDVSSPVVQNCFFIRGYANDDGGAVYNASGTRAQYINCVFANNEAKDEGGAVRNFECSPAFINCTFVYNKLPDNDPGGGGTYGPAIRNYQGTSPYMNTEPDIINCVFWMNVDGTEEYTFDISNTGKMADAGVYVNVVNCAIMDSVSASSCILIDTLDINRDNPGFIDVSGEAGYMGFDAASNWGLVESSVLIAEGTSSEPGVPEQDIEGKNRGSVIDIGAYEYESEVGVEKFAHQKFTVDVYPNPSSGIFRVRVESGALKELALFDMTGRIVFRDSNPGSAIDFSINLGDQKGVYLLRVSKLDGMISTKKVIVN